MGIGYWVTQAPAFPHASNTISLLLNTVLMFKDTVFILVVFNVVPDPDIIFHLVLDSRLSSISRRSYFGAHTKSPGIILLDTLLSHTHTQSINKSFGF